MQIEADADYFADRAREEAERAARAAEPVAAQVHAQLARLYRERAHDRTPYAPDPTAAREARMSAVMERAFPLAR